MRGRLLKFSSTVLLSILIVLAGAAWALGGCFEGDEGHKSVIGQDTSHASTTRIHCVDLRSRLDQFVQSQVSSREEPFLNGLSAKSCPEQIARADSKLPSRRFLESIASTGYSPGVKHYLFLSTFLI
jgi:hypothetical protein